MGAGIVEDPRWGAPARISESQNVPKCGERVQGKKRLWVKKSPLKTVALTVK